MRIYFAKSEFAFDNVMTVLGAHIQEFARASQRKTAKINKK